MATDPVLPARFRDLQIFASDWGRLQTAEERYDFRQRSSVEDLQEFYDRMQPRIADILSYLDSFPMDKPLPAAESCLCRIAFGLTEVAAALEVYGQPRIPYVPFPHYNKIEWIYGS